MHRMHFGNAFVFLLFKLCDFENLLYERDRFPEFVKLITWQTGDCCKTAK